MLRLGEEIDAFGAAELRAATMKALSDGEALILDSAAVCKIGTAGVQVLLAAARTAASAGKRVEISRPSDAVRAAFADLGLEEHLNAWSSQA